jgi:hypothetical protein
MTGLIYVNMRKQVGDPEHLKVRRRGPRGDLVVENHEAPVSGSRVLRQQ